MRMYDIISKKRDGFELTKEEIDFFIKGFLKSEIPDYQMSALSMAIYFKGMNNREITNLTDAMANSGEILDLSCFGDYSVDKHSTGGVGDKTTLIVAPIVASLGGKVAKMSGKGLGHTGGTIDKLSSFKGFNTEMTTDEFIKQVDKIGIAVIGQTGNLAPADKKLYALRDVTATVNSMPLIASSIMCKKIAAGSKSIVLDVKVGSGAFMKTYDDALHLADIMVNIGKECGKNIAAVISNMESPLGFAVGNILEVKEAISVLNGNGPSDLKEISLTLAAYMLCLCKNVKYSDARNLVIDAVESGKALSKFKEWIGLQGGNQELIENTDDFEQSRYIESVYSAKTGYINHIDSEKIGIAAVILGAGRQKKDDDIDLTAGIILKHKLGDFIKKGDIIAEFHTNNQGAVEAATNLFLTAFTIEKTKREQNPLIYKIIT